MRNHSFSVSPSQRYLENQTTAFDSGTNIKHQDWVNASQQYIHSSTIELKFKPKLTSKNRNEDPIDQYFTPRVVGSNKNKPSIEGMGIGLVGNQF
jgi:hypothetical protein